MAARVTKRDKLLVSDGIHPEAIQVVKTYSKGPGLEVQGLPLEPETGRTAAVGDSLPEGVAAVIVQQPNFLGVIEDLQPLAVAAKQMGALLVVMQNPMTLGVLESPAVAGADIAVGDVQVFGNSLSFGGPAAGYLACRKELMRQIPGRLVGQTLDADGRVSYTLTLQAREQHIRRAKATSNICSNQALCALAATIYLALLGPDGLAEVGDICVQRAHYLQKALCELPGVRPAAAGPFFYEFALTLPCNAEEFVSAMRQRGVDAGVPLPRIPGAEQLGDAQTLLVAVTEMNDPASLVNYIDSAREVLAAMPAPDATETGR
jgi:glycine dehydrogenase subunit 1